MNEAIDTNIIEEVKTDVSPEVKAETIKTFEEYSVELTDFLKKFIEEVNLNGHKVVGKTAFGMNFTTPEGEIIKKPFSIIFFQGGNVKSQLVSHSIGALSDLDDKADEMPEEELQAYMKDYLMKSNIVKLDEAS